MANDSGAAVKQVAVRKTPLTQGDSGGLSLGPIRYRRMADQIAAAIRESIASGKLPPGTHLREVVIANEMQTSRIPVREALMQLEQEALVVRKPNRGTFVAELTAKMLREVSSLRVLLEGFAVAQAAKRLTTDEFTRLDEILAEMRSAARDRDYLRVAELDYEFHHFVIRAAGHDLLEEVWKTTNAKVRTYVAATNLMPAELGMIVGSHQAALRALRSRNPDRAKKAMADHIEKSLSAMEARVLNLSVK